MTANSAIGGPWAAKPISPVSPWDQYRIPQQCEHYKSVRYGRIFRGEGSLYCETCGKEATFPVMWKMPLETSQADGQIYAYARRIAIPEPVVNTWDRIASTTWKTDMVEYYGSHQLSNETFRTDMFFKTEDNLAAARTWVNGT